MKYKFNPLTGEFNLVPDSGTLKQKLNWLTGNFNLTKDAGKYKQIYNVIEGEFNLRPAVTQVIVHGVGSIQLTNAVENGLLSLKAFGGTEQSNLSGGYTQLDSITSQSGAYIKSTTDIANLTKVVIDVDINIGGTTTQWLFGKYVLNKACSIEYAGSSGKIVCDLRSSTNRLAFNGTQVGRHILELDVTNRTFTVDGELVGTAGTSGQMAEGIYGLVGGFYNNFISNSATYYGVKVWENDVLVYDLVPCKNANDEVGMCNLVNGQFMGSDGEGTFIAGNVVVPTPTAPIDIVSNNGVLKARHQSGLPLGYKKLLSIYNSTSATLDTGIKLANTDRVETRFFNASASQYGAWYGIYATGESSAFYANGTYYGYDAVNNKINTGVSVDMDGHDLVHDFVNGKLTIDGEDTSFTPFEFTNTVNNKLFCRYYNGSYGYNVKGWLTYYKVYRNNILIQNLIPCTRESDNTIGMYDLVSGTFIGPDGGYTFEEGTVADDPIGVYADGVVETIGLYRPDTSITFTDGLYIGGTGYVNTGYVNWKTTDYIAVTPGTYKLTFTNNHSDYYKRVAFYTSNTETSGPILAAFDGRGLTGDQTVEFTVTQNGYVRMCLGKTDVFKSLEIPVGEATCEMLLKVLDYVDEQEILSGNITRKVGVLILDGITDGKKIGTAWNSTYKRGSFAVSGMASTASSVDDAICTHFDYSVSVYGAPTTYGFCTNNGSIFICFLGLDSITSAETANSWLAAQYNAGTPVIVLYPLTTATTETVTEQPLNIPEGDSTIEITQASLDNLELEATYEQEA